MFGRKTEEPTTRLRELSNSDFTIAKGEPDIRGWDVRDAQKRKFGTVNDLIFDIRAGKVRYLILNILDTPELDLEKRSVLVPIGLAELDATDNDVFLPTVNPFQLRALPRYDRSRLGAKAEHDVGVVFGYQSMQTDAGQQDVGENFYNNDHFNNNNLYRRRNQPDGLTHREQARHHEALPARDERLHGRDLDNRIETDEEYYRRTGQRRNRL
ncbi:PRC-barrel domain-containing protein [Cnuella takakiae]|uniref:PRC-barrel domain-containing protein n=1 Tax=Cnuella takakiae TaxID=1302690 RepID=A0A1M5CT26_9BACT|nr:PRC-barrel domain-containing protein [Cnuella takakiae]OLY91934.1 hypothetical protein BUE76_08525 [Cnuella takakiae]SHF57923.1 PRC-barrel domain-containing protein [Cnuella takakiae]